MEQQLIQCTGCKKKFTSGGFKLNRLHQRLKTCLECNERDLWRKQNHAKLRVNAFNTIAEQAIRNNWLPLINESEYVNGKTKVEWECITCGHIKLATWSMLRLVMKFECPDAFHLVKLRMYEQAQREQATRVEQKMATAACITRAAMLAYECETPGKDASRKDVPRPANGCPLCKAAFRPHENARGLCAACAAREWVTINIKPSISPAPSGP